MSVRTGLLTVQYDSSLFNVDLAPVPQKERTWSAWHYVALWVGMCVCIPAYMIASSLIQGGMNLWQALLTVFLGNVIGFRDTSLGDNDLNSSNLSFSDFVKFLPLSIFN